MCFLCKKEGHQKNCPNFKLWPLRNPTFNPKGLETPNENIAMPVSEDFHPVNVNTKEIPVNKNLKSDFQKSSNENIGGRNPKSHKNVTVAEIPKDTLKDNTPVPNPLHNSNTAQPKNS